jgi:hypothetical protein
MSLFLTVRQNETVYVEIPSSCGDGGPPVLVQIVLREKRGRTARLQFDAPREVHVDIQPRGAVKGAPKHALIPVA